MRNPGEGAVAKVNAAAVRIGASVIHSYNHASVVRWVVDKQLRAQR